jgi:O-antigen/teichoic acid export membrane protein
MFPAFSRMQDEPARIMAALNRVNQVIAAIAFPTLIGFAILAPEFTSVVLGSSWEGTETVIRCLAIGGMVLALQRVNYSVLSARGYSRLIMWVGGGALASTIVAILVAYPFGLNATVAAITLQTILLQAVIMYVTARALDARFRDVARPLGRIAVATAVMAASVILVVEVLRELGVGDTGILMAGILVGALVFLPLLLRLEPELIGELKGFARHGRGSTGDPEPAPSQTGAPLLSEQTGSR